MFDKPITHLFLVWVWAVPFPRAPSSVAPAPRASSGRASSSAHHSVRPAHQGRCTCPLRSAVAWPCMWHSFIYSVPWKWGWWKWWRSTAWSSNPLLRCSFTTYKLSSPTSSHAQDTLSGKMTEYNIWKQFARFFYSLFTCAFLFCFWSIMWKVC